MSKPRRPTFSVVLYPEEDIVETGLRRPEAEAYIAAYNRIMKPARYAIIMEEKPTQARLNALIEAETASNE